MVASQVTDPLNVQPLLFGDEPLRLQHYAWGVPETQEIVELGSWAGGSAAYLCEGTRGAHITCVDIWEDWIDPPPDQSLVLGEEAQARFMELTDPSVVTAFKCSSLQLAEFWTKPIGLLFIDALHTYEGCKADYEAWSGFVPSGGVLAIHDVLYPPRGDKWWTEGPTRCVDQVVIPSGLWEPLEHTETLWVARRT